jgi:hypothetical protein
MTPAGVAREDELCEAPCIVVGEQLQINSPYSSLRQLPVLSKVRMLRAGFLGFDETDKSKSLDGLPAMQTVLPEVHFSLSDVGDALETFEGIPPNFLSDLRLQSASNIRSFAGLEEQVYLGSIELFRTRLTSLSGLGAAPALRRFTIYLDETLPDLRGLTGIVGTLDFGIISSRIRSLAGAGDDLKFSFLKFTNNPDLSNCEALEFGKKYGLQVLAEQNGPCR